MQTNSGSSIESVVLSAQKQLSEAEVTDSPKLDAELLLAFCLGKDRTYLFTWSDKELNSKEIRTFTELLQKRLDGHPIAHIVGYREFWGLNLKVSPDTLIPRPDTETLIEAVLALPLPSKPYIVDLGTGTGAIALALKSELASSHISALDQSAKALAVAEENAKNLNLNIKLIQSNWFDELANCTFDCIVSNPPYIEESDPHLAQGDVRFEPITALTSGMDGLDDIRTIAKLAVEHLSTTGWLCIEHGYNQAEQVAEIFKENGFQNIQLKKDLGNNPRVTLGQYTPSQENNAHES